MSSVSDQVTAHSLS